MAKQMRLLAAWGTYRLRGAYQLEQPTDEWTAGAQNVVLLQATRRSKSIVCVGRLGLQPWPSAENPRTRTADENRGTTPPVEAGEPRHGSRTDGSCLER